MSAIGRPALDAGIVASGRHELVIATLRGLAGAGDRYELRTVVRDNGSSDGTADEVAREAPEVLVDRAPVDSGTVAGVNALLRLSDAPWFLVLAPGSVPAPDAIDRLVQTAEAHPRAAAVIPGIDGPGGRPGRAMGSFPSLRSAAAQVVRPALEPFAPQRELLERNARHRRRMLDRGAASRIAWALLDMALLRRRAIASVGLFDERFTMEVASLDWCWRAALRGWEVWLEPSAVVRGVPAGMAPRPAQQDSAAAWRWYRGTHGGVAAQAFRWLGTAGAARGAVAARRSRRPEMERYWREVLAAYRS